MTDPVLCQRPSIDSYTNDGEYSDTTSDSEVSDSENGERKLTSRYIYIGNFRSIPPNPIFVHTEDFLNCAGS